MVRDGLFDDLDVVLAWHPSDEIAADTEGNQAMVDFVVEFEGRTAHAAYDPWNGRSAADGARALHLRAQPDARARAADGAHALRGHRRRRRAQRRARPRPGLVSGCATRATPASTAAGARASDRRGRGARHRHHRHGSRVQAGDCEMLLNMAGARLHPRQPDVARPDRVHRRGAGVRARDPARHRRRADRAQGQPGAARARSAASPTAARPTSAT